MTKPGAVIDAPSNLGLRPPGKGREPGVRRSASALRGRGIAVRLGAEKARYYPEDERFLLHFEPTVGHYEVVVEP